MNLERKGQLDRHEGSMSPKDQETCYMKGTIERESYEKRGGRVSVGKVST